MKTNTNAIRNSIINSLMTYNHQNPNNIYSAQLNLNNLTSISYAQIHELYHLVFNLNK